MNRSLLRLAVALPLLAGAAPAFAHPGHGSHGDLVAGLLHPLAGVDHLAAMLMVGLWAGLAFPRRTWTCPAAFLGAMLVGFGWGAAGLAFPFAEALILASLLGFGGALLFALRPPLGVGVAIVALFALGHGYAHGSELPAGGAPIPFAAGFALTTAMLLATGIAAARVALLRRMAVPGRVAGAAGAMLSITLLYG